MKSYIYVVKNFSNKRGYNRTIEVFRLKNNKPIYVGYDEELSTASYKGDYAIACKIISENDKHRMKKGGYFLESEYIKVYEL